MRNWWLKIFIGLVLMVNHAAFAQVSSVDSVYTALDTTIAEDEDYSEELVFDTAINSNRIYYSKDSIRNFRSQKEFDYINKPLDSLLKRRQEKQPPPVQTTTRREPTVSFGDIFSFLIWLIVIGGVLFLIYRLFLSEKGLFAAPAHRKKLSSEETEMEDDDSFTKRIADAEKKGAYRLAVRYQYLHLLNTLAAKEWVQLSPDKTNYQYLRELSGKPVRNDFARITLHYDYAWYGNFEVDVNVYQTIKNEFQQLQRALK
jgi:Domain of unknown function (DUF4129)